MASTLLELRKAAGYKTAPEFAEAQDIAQSTYARYESNPEKIPLPTAWRFADLFGCSIDVIVGRVQVDPSLIGDDVQTRFDRLTDEGKAELEGYLDYLVYKEGRDRARAAREERARFDELARRYEAMFIYELSQTEEGADFMAFASPKAMRDRFDKYIQKKAHAFDPENAKTDRPLYTEDMIAEIVESYDRIHKTHDFELRGKPRWVPHEYVPEMVAIYDSKGGEDNASQLSKHRRK